MKVLVDTTAWIWRPSPGRILSSSGDLSLFSHVTFSWLDVAHNTTWASVIAQLVKKIHLQCRRPWYDSWVRKIHCRWDRLPTSVVLGFPDGSASKESSCNVGDLGLNPELGRYPGQGTSYPLQYSGPEFHGLYGHGVAKSQTWLSDFHFHFFLPASGSFPMSQLFATSGQSIGPSASVLPMSNQV